jgi:hypothetical protein
VPAHQPLVRISIRFSVRSFISPVQILGRNWDRGTKTPAARVRRGLTIGLGRPSASAICSSPTGKLGHARDVVGDPAMSLGIGWLAMSTLSRRAVVGDPRQPRAAEEAALVQPHTEQAYGDAADARSALSFMPRAWRYSTESAEYGSDSRSKPVMLNSQAVHCPSSRSTASPSCNGLRASTFALSTAYRFSAVARSRPRGARAWRRRPARPSRR